MQSLVWPNYFLLLNMVLTSGIVLVYPYLVAVFHTSNKTASTPTLLPLLCNRAAWIFKKVFYRLFKTQLGHGRGLKCISFLPLSSGVYTDDPTNFSRALVRAQVSRSDSTSSPRQGKLSLNPQKRWLLIARGLAASFAGSWFIFPPNCSSSLQMHNPFFTSTVLSGSFLQSFHYSISCKGMIWNNPIF